MLKKTIKITGAVVATVGMLGMIVGAIVSAFHPGIGASIFGISGVVFIVGKYILDLAGVVDVNKTDMPELPKPYQPPLPY